MTRAPKPADILNRECECRTLDLEALQHALGSHADGASLYQAIVESRPHLFSATPVFVSRDDVDAMARIIGAIEQVVALPAYRDHVMHWAPAVARHDFGPRGVFLGYDFHLSPTGPRLIEINTNAGGALLNTVLARAQLACCVGVDIAGLPGLERALFDMFLEEWRRQRGARPLVRIAVVDDAPDEQYLQPEFALFQRLFQAHGVDAVIADPAALTRRGGALWCGGERVDLVYNRLTDFALVEARHQALCEAYEAGEVVVTPHPRAHALYADKRNLAVLGDAALLRAWALPEETIAILRGAIPRTVLVERANAEQLWADRRTLFFKPASGYGSKAAYRGDKLTRRVFGEILAGGYVAQELVPPTERRARVGNESVTLKFDLRGYVYGGQVQLLAARLYQGQTTNFRTAGGGFAPVFYPSGVAGTGATLRDALTGAARANA